MINFLEETGRAIDDSGHCWGDVDFIGSEETGHSCTVDEFKVIADEEYGNGFGAAKVASDLIIVFKDNTSMSRGEYDGSEWWEYRKRVEVPTELKPITRLIGGAWDTVEEMNKESK